LLCGALLACAACAAKSSPDDSVGPGATTGGTNGGGTSTGGTGATAGTNGTGADGDGAVPPDLQEGPGTYKLGPFSVDVAADGGVRIRHEAAPDLTLWETVSGRGFSSAWVATDSVTENRGALKIEETVTKRCGDEGAVTAKRDGDVMTLVHTHAGAGCEGFGATLELAAKGEHDLTFKLTAFKSTPATTRVTLVYATEADEGFFGFGEQFTYLNLRGREVPVVIQEQGLGRGNSLVSSVVNLGSEGSAGSWSSTYAAVPFYITNRGRSLFLENDEMSWFDLTKDTQVEVRVRATEMRGRILYGENPAQQLEAFTAYAGRMDPLPDFLNEGAVIGMQGGTDKVRAMLDSLDAYDTPIGAFWLQDWVGKRQTTLASQLWWNWQLNDEQYPGWDTLVSDLEQRDIRMLTYVNPFLVDVSDQSFFTRNLYIEARDKGFLVKDEMGMPYAITNTTFDAGLLDLSNPDAVAWFEDVVRDEVLAVGASGYMADYGEALPFDAVLASGESAASFHNRYPEVWQALHRRVLADAGLLGEAAFFARSAYTKSPGVTTLFWLGDQMVTWDGDDGLASAIKGLLSGGLSGMSLNHGDIGGYAGYAVVLQRNQELLMRWIEFAAFTAVYRTHEGTAPDSFAQIDDNATTLSQFSKFAKVFAALAPYRTKLMQEAKAKGLPLARHLLLEYPNDEKAWAAELEFMLGSDVLVAPVVTQGASKVSVYIPEGEWIQVFANKTFATPGTYEVDAPIGKPAVFAREGSEAAALLAAAIGP